MEGEIVEEFCDIKFYYMCISSKGYMYNKIVVGWLLGKIWFVWYLDRNVVLDFW